MADQPTKLGMIEACITTIWDELQVATDSHTKVRLSLELAKLIKLVDQKDPADTIEKLLFADLFKWRTPRDITHEPSGSLPVDPPSSGIIPGDLPAGDQPDSLPQLLGTSDQGESGGDPRIP